MMEAIQDQIIYINQLRKVSLIDFLKNAEYRIQKNNLQKWH